MRLKSSQFVAFLQILFSGLFLFCFFVLLGFYFGEVKGDSRAVVSFEPSSQIVQQGSEVFVDINIKDVVDLYAFLISFSYNSQVLEYKEAIVGPFLTEGGSVNILVIPASISDGEVRSYAVSRTSVLYGVNGSGQVARFKFLAKSAGQSGLNFISSRPSVIYNTEFQNANHIEIPVDLMNGQVTVQGSGPICSNECSTSGVRQCSGSSAFQICGNYDADTCLEWSNVQSCPSGQTCSGGQCVLPQPTCSDECSPSGKTSCVSSGSFKTCGNYDTDICLEWSSAQDCLLGQICSTSINACAFPQDKPTSGLFSASKTQVKTNETVTFAIQGQDTDGIEKVCLKDGNSATPNCISCSGQISCYKTWVVSKSSPGPYYFYGYVYGLTPQGQNQSSQTNPAFIMLDVQSDYNICFKNVCYLDDVWCYDSNNQRQTKKEECGVNTPTNVYECQGSLLYQQWQEKGCATSTNTCFTKTVSKLYRDCGNTTSTNEYRCLNNILQRKQLNRGCVNSACYENEQWQTIDDCSLSSKTCDAAQRRCVGSALTAACLIEPSSAIINEPVWFIAKASGGLLGPYQYTWSGAIQGTTQTVQKIFSQAGNYSINLLVTAGTQNKSASCLTNISATSSCSCSAWGSWQDIGCFREGCSVNQMAQERTRDCEANCAIERETRCQESSLCEGNHQASGTISVSKISKECPNNVCLTKIKITVNGQDSDGLYESQTYYQNAWHSQVMSGNSDIKEWEVVETKSGINRFNYCGKVFGKWPGNKQDIVYTSPACVEFSVDNNP